VPGIGNPYQDSTNAYRGISIGPKAKGTSKPNEVGSELNKIAGVNEESQFVDAKKHNQMDKNAFLKLLANQLQNQDPSSPMDQKKFAADLAQFSQLEQLTNLNQKFDNKDSQATSEMRFMGASFIGKMAETSGTSVNVSDDSPPEINLPFYLPKSAKKLMIRVFDKDGNMVQQMDLDGMGKGSQSVAWDKKMLDNTKAINGAYAFQVRAWDDSYNEFKGETKSSGMVTGVSFEGSETVLTIDGNKKVFLRDVNSFAAEKKNDMAKNAALSKLQNQAYNNHKQDAIE
jgi:flagellar basal-body rod modification protein FlgD